jgi:hypothetical protein
MVRAPPHKDLNPPAMICQPTAINRVFNDYVSALALITVRLACLGARAKIGAWARSQCFYLAL